MKNFISPLNQHLNQQQLTTENNYHSAKPLPHTSELLNLNNSEPKSRKPVWLWKAQKKDCAPIYIFGTQHKVNFDPNEIFGEAIKNTVEKVDIVFTEIEIPSNKFEDKTAIDCWVAGIGNEQNKTLKPLENERARSYFGVASCFLKSNVTHIDPSIVDKCSEQYLSGETITKTIKVGGKLDSLAACTTRNLYWLRSITEHSKDKKTCLVAVGALHNTGEMGLPRLLEEEGYTVKPLMTSIPTKQEKNLQLAIHENRLFCGKFPKKILGLNISAFFPKYAPDNNKDKKNEKQKSHCLEMVPVK